MLQEINRGSILIDIKEIIFLLKNEQSSYLNHGEWLLNDEEVVFQEVDFCDIISISNPSSWSLSTQFGIWGQDMYILSLNTQVNKSIKHWMPLCANMLYWWGHVKSQIEFKFHFWVAFPSLISSPVRRIRCVKKNLTSTECDQLFYRLTYVVQKGL